MRIAVIDDERPARSELKHQLWELLKDAQIDEGESGAQALEMAGEVCYDLFFLDINLGDINGTVLVNALKNMQPAMKIVFVTAYSEYAVKAFELEVEDYIMKPFDKKRLEKMLKKCKITKKAEKGTDSVRRIAINTEGKTIFKEVGDIVYIETYNRGCMIHTVENDYFEGKTIGEFEKKLGDMGFFRSQKSFLVNLNKVKELFLWKNNSFAIKMEGYEKEILPVGREKIKVLRQLLGG
ncbi:response regulator [Lachnospiraceae bacterium WCA-9-b2]|uniref:Stage 0 sporulation protein A homolog n=1 Tax=Sporofaciens musculi TaxID=2681861 RepID=A0A7X3MFK1_9FIRM|nr:LytTR family DNA-binding domain-containing protein [Sporofaciens musculi]MCI9422485.1 response regulator transcription factor [Dorea sp.]MXP75456.1 response regulator [Sporofaciens musculi]